MYPRSFEDHAYLPAPCSRPHAHFGAIASRRIIAKMNSLPRGVVTVRNEAGVARRVLTPAYDLTPSSIDDVSARVLANQIGVRDSAELPPPEEPIRGQPGVSLELEQLFPSMAIEVSAIRHLPLADSGLTHRCVVVRCLRPTCKISSQSWPSPPSGVSSLAISSARRARQDTRGCRTHHRFALCWCCAQERPTIGHTCARPRVGQPGRKPALSVR